MSEIEHLILEEASLKGVSCTFSSVFSSIFIKNLTFFNLCRKPFILTISLIFHFFLNAVGPKVHHQSKFPSTWNFEMSAASKVEWNKDLYFPWDDGHSHSDSVQEWVIRKQEHFFFPPQEILSVNIEALRESSRKHESAIHFWTVSQWRIFRGMETPGVTNGMNETFVPYSCFLYSDYRIWINEQSVYKVP